MKPGELIYVARAAEILCCEPDHVYKMIKDAKIEAVRLGVRGVRVIKASVERYIIENKINPEDYYK